MRCLLRAALPAFLAISLFACSTANDKAPTIDPRTGRHPSGWAAAGTGGNHPAAFLAVPSACYECHGRDLAGGISGVSCFSSARSGISCHAGGPSGHPAGWADADAHGAAAKAISSGLNGLAHCQVCHGSDFSGGIAQKSCLNTDGCHGAGVMAAHSRKPWRSAIGGRTHVSTDASNAAACAVCHSGGANSSRIPTPAAPAGTPPGCFNNTLCHGVEGHLTGWNLPTAHGAAAKAPAGGDKGFSFCAQCHGTGYDGGIAEQSCLNGTGCHGAAVAAPHPARPWRSTTGGTTHTSTDTSNAGQCATCHTGGANSTRAPRPGDPVGSTGCFNNTLCHGTEGHAAGWSAAAQHGASAKQAPSASSGFSSCQPCHGSTFNNGSAPSCMNTLGCHGLTVSSPHPQRPWFSTTGGLTHTTTDPANAATCAICHTGGANSTIVSPNPATGAAGCFNNTLCHFHQIPFAPSATIPASLHGGLARQDLTVCQACHGTRGTTAFDGFTLADGTKTVACSSCHTFARAHATDWQGSGTFSHRTAGNIANACSLCHDVTQGRTAPLAAAPSCFSASFTNGAGQSRTCHAGGPGVAPHNVPYNNHNATARSNFAYCLGCHQVAADVTTAGGKVIPRCLTCHLSDPTTASVGCVSCHANPPSGTTYPNAAGTHGGHSASVIASLPTGCSECHSGLGLGTVDHLNRARARAAAVLPNPVVFGTLAKTGAAAATYTDATLQCTNVYCHGGNMPGGDTTGTNRAPTWPDTAYLPATISAAACGTCHGFPPSTASGHPGGITIPAGFPGSAPIGSTCSCHSNINTAGNSYATIFVNLALHINGVLETPLSGHAVPNYNHQSAGTGAACTGCHAIGSATSVYPASVLGNAPDCRGCHKKGAPGTGCNSCHGDAATGRPNGTAFPDKTGRHQGSGDGAHLSAACTKCHILTTSGSGTTVNHGPGNRDTNPDVVGPGFITGITVTGASKGVSPTVTCDHATVNANNGGGCGGGPSSATW